MDTPRGRVAAVIGAHITVITVWCRPSNTYPASTGVSCGTGISIITGKTVFWIRILFAIPRPGITHAHVTLVIQITAVYGRVLTNMIDTAINRTIICVITVTVDRAAFNG
jgi:hypothetical protein